MSRLEGQQPVVRAVRFFMAHAPGLVRHGSKPAREIASDPGVLSKLQGHLRSWAEAATYPPNRVLLGSLSPDDLAAIPRPWYAARGTPERFMPQGELMPEEAFLGALKLADSSDLVWLAEGFAARVREALAGHPHLAPRGLERGGVGQSPGRIERQIGEAGALPLVLRSGEIVGCARRAHEQDPSLAADVLLENLAAKATAVAALRHLLGAAGVEPGAVPYVLNCGEEAVGDRYQRGGGNLAKAIAEGAGCLEASGSDVKAFCCAPLHALLVGGALVQAGVFPQVAVVAGGSLAKLGMKFQGHLKHDQPVLEDVLAGAAVLIGRDDGRSPVLRLDAVGRHPVRAGGSQQEIYGALVAEPLARLGLRFDAVDRYATELHNPEVTEPAGSGDVPRLNYRLIATLAARRGEIEAGDIERFAAEHGMPGFSPTQGHIASAVCFLGHALLGLTRGDLRRVMLVGKGSLFLGRMTQLADGLSMVLERNPAG